MINIVLGAGFGDEGKGSVVSKICKEESISLIVRFNGGHQVGHTVVKDGIRHVFSNFGSGSLQGIPTYWSRFCTVHPTGILNEYAVLRKKGITPHLYIDPLCPIVTPFDINHNRHKEMTNKHGSVGVGFGSTIERNENFVRLYAQDLKYPQILQLKLEQIAKYYGSFISIFTIKIFTDEINEMLNIPSINILKPVQSLKGNLVFEGGQGILLDQDFGFFPHVTRSNTTSKNAFELIKELDLKTQVSDIQVNYVTRPYLTRHGAGPLPNESKCSYIRKNPNETNVYNDWQLQFRYAPLNIDLLNYSIDCDNHFSRNIQKQLWVTCADQVDEFIPVIINERVEEIKIDSIAHYSGIYKNIIKRNE